MTRETETRETAADKVRKLERLARGSMGGEHRNALAAAEKLRARYGFTDDEIYPREVKRGEFAVTVRIPFNDLVKDEWTAIAQGAIFERLLRRMVLDMGVNHPLDMGGAVFATVREVEAPKPRRRRRKKRNARRQ